MDKRNQYGNGYYNNRHEVYELYSEQSFWKQEANEKYQTKDQ